MAIVIYRCDTCRREVELIENKHGLETIQRCVITHGCRGKLFQVNRLEDFSRASIPAEVGGLDDWIPRRVLFNHTQTIENTVWIINHNLGTFPSVSVFVDRPTTEDPDNREEITPSDIQIVNTNTILLVFDRPRSGIAQLVARSSDPQLYNPVTTATTTQVVPIQITNSSQLVIATKVKPEFNVPSINIRLNFLSSSGGSTLLDFTAGGSASDVTAWGNADRVVIKGKVYQVRSMLALTEETTFGTIANGTNFRFEGFDFDGSLNFNPVASGEIYILLSSSPYASVDKTLDQVIDVTSVTSTLNPFAFYYDTGELFASSAIAQSVFPSVRVL
jgi:hypothetical protein